MKPHKEFETAMERFNRVDSMRTREIATIQQWETRLLEGRTARQVALQSLREDEAAAALGEQASKKRFLVEEVSCCR